MGLAARAVHWCVQNRTTPGVPITARIGSEKAIRAQHLFLLRYPRLETKATSQYSGPTIAANIANSKLETQNKAHLLGTLCALRHFSR